MTDLSINAVVSLAGLRCVAPLRRAVFIDEQRVSEGLEWDEHDADACHYVARLRSGEIVAVARVVATGPTCAKVQRVAVRRDLRGLGIGRELMLQILADAEASGVSELTLDAQTHAVGFYRGLGFDVCSASFLDAGIAHMRMSRHIGGSHE
jgi:predicted GNAT family N-acyltransferase